MAQKSAQGANGWPSTISASRRAARRTPSRLWKAARASSRALSSAQAGCGPLRPPASPAAHQASTHAATRGTQARRGPFRSVHNRILGFTFLWTFVALNSFPTTMPPTRSALRQALLSAREAWAASPDAIPAQADLHAHLARVLEELEPDCLGLYWPTRGEFNPRGVALELQASLNCQLALPWATRASGPKGSTMVYRQWDGQEPATRDECGIACPDTAPARPDVVLVPCVGFTRAGFRLG
ncbi:MAG: hypothetical protein EOP40_14240, partial [Rubrivivax sp.]